MYYQLTSERGREFPTREILRQLLVFTGTSEEFLAQAERLRLSTDRLIWM